MKKNKFSVLGILALTLALALVLGLVFVGCATNGTGSGYETTYALGDTGPGSGKIFYYDPEGFTMMDNGQVCHYLEAAPADMAAMLWASSGFSGADIAGTERAIGTGRKNTALILAIDANAPAAKACNDYSNNGKTDWFLPSFDELTQLYLNRTSAGIAVMESNSPYWTSWQDEDTEWVTIVARDNPWGASNKGGPGSVRAIRAF